MTTRKSLATALSALAVASAAWSQDPSDKPGEPVKLSAKDDHRRLMDLLKMKEIRRGADGNPKSANAANTDESKANPFPDLPDPLTTKAGEKVTTADAWWNVRRPEIVEDFDREIYGRVPKDTPKVTWEVVSTSEETVGEIPAVTKKLVGHVDNSTDPAITVDIQLTLTTPAKATGPVPVMMEFGFAGFGPPRAGTAKKGTPPRPRGGGPSWQEQVLAKGWGYAILVPNSIQADNGAGLTKGIIGLCNKGQPRGVEDWGALRAWAWGGEPRARLLRVRPRRRRQAGGDRRGLAVRQGGAGDDGL